MKKLLCYPSRTGRRTGGSVCSRVLFWVGVAAAAAVLIAVGWVTYEIWNAPDMTTVDAVPHGYRTTILDGDGEEAKTLYVSESNRIYAELDQIPRDLQNAFVAIEDARFYDHHGIDLRGIGRAFVRGIQSGNFSEGGSTITQQLLKNNVFTDWMSEKTFGDRLSRKVQEMYLALRLERQCSKDWILENYLNTINLGGGTRGVQVASQYYFGKDVSELTLPEAALIAGITKSPNAYNPLRHGEKSLDRQALVLSAMKSEGYITQEEYESAKAEDVLSHLVQDPAENGQGFDWFQDALVLSIVSDLEERRGCSEEEAWNLIYGGGLTIYSTEDRDLQRLCEKAVQSGDYQQAGEEASLVMTQVSTGAVVAIVGGREEKTANLIYNRATDAIRQPGSTIKVIGEYAAALDKGLITLGTTMDDEPFAYADGTPLHNAEGTYGGMTTVRQGISNSCNVLALKTFRLAGEKETAACLEGFGISTLDGQDYENEALSIGGTYHGVTNLEMTAAYNAIANGGCYQEPHFYTKIVDHNGDILLENPENGKQVIQESTAALLTLAMEDVMENGTGQTANPSSLRVAGKSGTTNDRRDVWFVGFSRDYTCGVWGGFDDNSEQEDNGYVKRLWKAVMEGTSGQSGSRKELADTSGLTSEKICTKCGKLAVSGLCDHTLQGDMTVKEWFVPGTEPTERCTCHVRLSICGDSGKLANTWCPLSSRDTGVYLTSGTAGTADEAYSAEGIDKETTCDVHTHMQDFFSGIFHSDGEENQTEDSGSEEHDSGGSWWSSLWGGGESGSGSGESSYGSGDSGSYGSSGWNEDSGSHGSGSWNGDSGSHGSSSWSGDSGSHGSSSWSEDSYENDSDSGHGSGGWFDDWFSGWGGWSDSWSPW